MTTPRFGLIVLSEIASRALSPAVNDPGTAFERHWHARPAVCPVERAVAPVEHRAAALPAYDHVEVPELSFRDMFDDAFTGIARDGAATVESPVDCKSVCFSAVLSGGVLGSPRGIMHGWRGQGGARPTLPEDREEIRRLAALVGRR